VKLLRAKAAEERAAVVPLGAALPGGDVGGEIVGGEEEEEESQQGSNQDVVAGVHTGEVTPASGARTGGGGASGSRSAQESASQSAGLAVESVSAFDALLWASDIESQLEALLAQGKAPTDSETKDELKLAIKFSHINPLLLGKKRGFSAFMDGEHQALRKEDQAARLAKVAAGEAEKVAAGAEKVEVRRLNEAERVAKSNARGVKRAATKQVLEAAALKRETKKALKEALALCPTATVNAWRRNECAELVAFRGTH